MNIENPHVMKDYRIHFTCAELTGEEVIVADICSSMLKGEWSSIDITSCQDAYAKEIRKKAKAYLGEEFTHDIHVWEDQDGGLQVTLYKLMEDSDGLVYTDMDTSYECKLIKAEMVTINH